MNHGAGRRFDRVVKQDGTVSWEAATPRRAKSAWRAVVRLVIRPPRATYDSAELGPLAFEIPGLERVRRAELPTTGRGGRPRPRRGYSAGDGSRTAATRTFGRRGSLRSRPARAPQVQERDDRVRPRGL